MQTLLEPAGRSSSGWESKRVGALEPEVEKLGVVLEGLADEDLVVLFSTLEEAMVARVGMGASQDSDFKVCLLGARVPWSTPVALHDAFQGIVRKGSNSWAVGWEVSLAEVCQVQRAGLWQAFG